MPSLLTPRAAHSMVAFLGELSGVFCFRCQDMYQDGNMLNSFVILKNTKIPGFVMLSEKELKIVQPFFSNFEVFSFYTIGTCKYDASTGS